MSVLISTDGECWHPPPEKAMADPLVTDNEDRVSPERARVDRILELSSSLDKTDNVTANSVIDPDTKVSEKSPYG